MPAKNHPSGQLSAATHPATSFGRPVAPGGQSGSNLGANTRDWLLAVLGGQPADPTAVQDDNFALSVMTLASCEGVLPLLHTACAQVALWDELPIAMRETLQRHARKAAADDLRTHVALTAATAQLNREEIPFLVLKGAAIAQLLYPEPQLRVRYDVDLLFSDRAATDRAADLLASLGYTRRLQIDGDLIAYQYSCCLPADRRARCLDMHWRVSNSRRLARLLSFDEMQATSIALPDLGAEVHCPALPHLLLHACLHRLVHRSRGQENRLIWLYDIHLLALRMNAAQWHDLVEVCRKKGCARVCLHGLRAAQRYFASPINPERLEALQGLIADEPVLLPETESRLRYELAEWRALPSWSDRIKLLREHLLPSSEYMIQRYGLQSSMQIPAAYLRRIFRGIARRRS